MNASPANPPMVSPGAIVMNVLGTLMLAAGVAGLFAPAALAAVPALADSATAWTLTLAGVTLDAYSTLLIVQSLRRRR